MPLFQPILAGANLRDRLLAGLGAAAGILVTGIVSALVTGGAWPLLVAPIGASAVLVFAVPASPLAQPWPVIGGNILSAGFGVAVAAFIPNGALAAAIAVGGAIMLMSLARCLHPPGGAAALSAVLLAGTGHLGWLFPFVPVGINSLLLVGLGIGFHRWTRHPYPHHAPAARPIPGFTPADIDAALADMGETFDIAREDLDALLARAAEHARRR